MLHPIQPGQILLDKYRVERVLGKGGMGIVVAARHLALDELVAIKFMLGNGSPAELSRFVREARAAVRLKSQHVARVLDVAALEDGTPYMVLEHLNGNDLAHVLREQGPLPVGEAVDFIIQACEAIAEAHSIGIIHRDIKPANLFLTRGLDGSPNVKVLDFGIAKWTNASTAKMDPSQPMGSAPYMAVEQFAATNLVDPRTDVWAIGATLFHLLTGRTPFHHDDVDSIQSMMFAVMHRPPLRPCLLRPELPEVMDDILLRCLEKPQSERFPSVAALAAVLAPLGSEQAGVYAKRVARVLGEAEPKAQVVAQVEVATAPLPPVAAATVRIPEQRAVEASSGAAVPSSSDLHSSARSVDAVGEGKSQRTLVLGVAAVVGVVGVLLIGMRLGRESATGTTSMTTTPEAKTTAAAEPREVASSGAAAPSPAPAASVMDTHARLENSATAGPSRVAPASVPRKNVASPAATASSTPAPKENLYGRRR